ncbi:MAG: hypothetical protein LQ340_001998 [Diploschistes diacapsis]|nr:MAG: hypothetical protein LQ340_001998 [Diploschistes diacapsis]
MASNGIVGGPQAQSLTEFQDLVVNKQYTDWAIVAGEKRYHVHSVVPCAQSEYFRSAMKGGDWKEGKTHEISVDDDPCLLGSLIGLLHGNILAPECTVDDIIELHALASKRLCPGAKLKCEMWFREHFGSRWYSDEFLTAVKRVYEGTEAGDPALKTLYSSIIKAHHLNLMKKDEFRELTIRNYKPCGDVLNIVSVKRGEFQMSGLPHGLG